MTDSRPGRRPGLAGRSPLGAAAARPASVQGGQGPWRAELGAERAIRCPWRFASQGERMRRMRRMRIGPDGRIHPLPDSGTLLHART